MANEQLLRKTMSARVIISVIACVLGTVGCHRARTDTSAASAPIEFTQPVTLAVANHNWLDVTVYVVHGSQRTRILTVTATHDAATVVPLHALQPSGEIRLLAHAVGDPTPFLSELIVAKSGMTISWTLESDLKRSSLAVW